MPVTLDFMTTTNDEDQPQRELLPEDRYLVKIATVDEGRRTKRGDEMWRIGLVVVLGDYIDRWVNDNIVFSAAARTRLRSFLGALRLEPDVLYPEDIKGKIVWVDVEHDTYVRDGQERTVAAVAFEGYIPATQQELDEYEAVAAAERSSASVADDDLPF